MGPRLITTCSIKNETFRKTRRPMSGEIPSQGSHIVVLTTVGGEEEARELIRGLVEDRVIACGTMVGATSIFRWEGVVSE